MAKEGEKPKAEIKPIPGIFTDYVDISGRNSSALKQSLTEAINAKRARMAQLDPIGCVVVRGGDERLRAINLRLLKIACEALMFRLINDDPNSETAEWSRNHSGATPYMFREISGLQVSGKDGRMLSRPGLVVCVNGSIPDLRSEVFDEMVAELGLTLTALGQRSIYPRGWDGRQAATLDTIAKG